MDDDGMLKHESNTEPRVVSKEKAPEYQHVTYQG
jgi:hypothetical protein